MNWIVSKPFADRATNTKAAWVADMLNASESIANRIGISPEAVVAQAAQESGWGASRQGQFGLFGQKAGTSWKGLKVLCRTREFINGEYITIDDWFCDYASMQEAIEDHFAFLIRNTRYRDAGVFDRKGDEHYFYALQHAGYATDPHYAENLIAVQDTVVDYFMPHLARSDRPVTKPRPVLMIGSTGDNVKVLQTALASLGFYKGTVDGDFGRFTYNAVLTFQKSKVLTVDGVVGDQTYDALGIT